MSNTTEKLSLNLLSGLEKVNKDTFNDIIEDIDNKCVGIHHLHENSHWKLWEKDTDYAKGDVVRTTTCKSNQYFQCIVGGTSGKDEPKNQGTGAQITDNTAIWIINEIGSSGSSNGGAVIFVGEKYYTKGQLAIFNGVLYRSIRDHIAEQTFQLDIANWQKLYSNIREWTDSTFYFSNEIVISDNKLYKCKQDHVSAGTFVSDINTWKSLSSNGIETFKPSTYYNDGAIVIDGNRLYRCTLAHTSTTDLISDIQNWELLSNVQDWESNKTYIQGNIVINDKKIYRCTAVHTSTTTFDKTKWEEISALENTVRPWAIKTDYKANDLIYIDNVLYKCNTAHTSTTFSADVSKWDNMYSNIRDFADNTFYKKGSYVLYNNDIYKALKDTTGDISNHLQLQSSATFRDSNNTYTKIIGTDILRVPLMTEPNGNYINTVIDLGNVYDVTKITLGDIVHGYCKPGETIIETSTNGTSYIEANSFTTGGYDNFGDTTLNINKKARYIKIVFKSVYRGSGGTGDNFDLRNVSIYTANKDWKKITNTQKPTIEAWTSNTDYSVNEVVIYNNKIYKCNKAHTSTTDFGADKLIYWNSLNDNPIINDWASGTTYEVGSMIIISNANNISEWTTNTSYNANDEVIYNGYIYMCKTANTDTEFTEANWEIKEPVYNRIYRCIKNTNSKTFDESSWQLINGDSKATVDEVDELLA